MATTDEIIKSLRKNSEIVTNINNINYNNNINNINNSMTSVIVSDDSNPEERNSLRSSSGLASLSASPKGSLENISSRDSINFVGGSELPGTWRGLKWDIYQNKSANHKINLKVKMTVIKQDRTTIGLTASMNSPHDRLWRGVEDRTTPHWQAVNEQYQDYFRCFGKSLDLWRASKFYLNNKKGSVDQFTLFMLFADNSYNLRLIVDSQIFDYNISRDSWATLSQSQRDRNQIATAFYGRSQVKLINPRELGLL